MKIGYTLQLLQTSQRPALTGFWVVLFFLSASGMTSLGGAQKNSLTARALLRRLFPVFGQHRPRLQHKRQGITPWQNARRLGNIREGPD